MAALAVVARRVSALDLGLAVALLGLGWLVQRVAQAARDIAAGALKPAPLDGAPESCTEVTDGS